MPAKKASSKKNKHLEPVGEEKLEPAHPEEPQEHPGGMVTFGSEQHFRSTIHRQLSDVLERLGSIEEHLGIQRSESGPT